ncbi:hypothetical protein RchiOBHm_Chr2g0161111 [Rosa chinensis]|uniref:Uncharacterized protein n=1 Tax=Rosa chinensis TaxID=74649 RepID=A0A2P6S2N4_ROSCH|nr:hypothetical protein RchiOBHm_Chr2g0161111 [Rosa chinensis]
MVLSNFGKNKALAAILKFLIVQFVKVPSIPGLNDPCLSYTNNCLLQGNFVRLIQAYHIPVRSVFRFNQLLTILFLGCSRPCRILRRRWLFGHSWAPSLAQLYT